MIAYNLILEFQGNMLKVTLDLLLQQNSEKCSTSFALQVNSFFLFSFLLLNVLFERQLKSIGISN